MTINLKTDPTTTFGNPENKLQMKLHIPAKEEADKPGILILGNVDGSGTLGNGIALWADNTGSLRYHTDIPTDEDSDGSVLSSGSSGATKALDNLASVAINTSLISDADDTDDLGSSSIGWANLYVSTAVYADTISEKTSATGVTIDGVLLKDSKLNTSYLTTSSMAQGDILYNDGTNWVRLAAGSSGQYLETQGSGSNPQWSNPSALTAGGLNSPFTVEGGTYDPTTTVTSQTSSAASLSIPDLGGTAQEWVFSKASQTLENKTLTTPVIADGGYIADGNGNEYLAFGQTTSAVNEIKITNSATGNGVQLETTGGDAAIDLLLVAKGSGVVKADTVEVATISGTQTLTNKTITGSVVETLDYTGGNTITFQNAVHTVVGKDTTDTLTNKTIDADGTGNTLSNINGDELDPITVGTNLEAVPIIITKDVSNAATTDIYSSDAPYKIRIIDAWVVSTAAANSGTWKLDDGTNDITTAVNYGTSDTDLVRASAIDDAYHEISASGSLRCINSSATDDALLYIQAIRVD